MSEHEFFMRRALELAKKSRIKAPPNPWVGCVITKNKDVIGEGSTDAAGGPHAEVNALNNCKDSPENSTVYATLEPCSFTGRTPPCADALIKAKPEKVFVAIEDPDTNVAGLGIKKLREAGIDVEVGLLEKEASNLLAPYLHHRRTGLPFTVMKAAMSIDGRMAASDGSSRWISSDEARVDAHRLRAESGAIVIGVGTALADHPSLTVRDWPESPQTPPLRVVLDSTGKLSATGPLFDVSLAPTQICTSSTTPEKKVREWLDAGVEVQVLEKMTLKSVLTDLGRRGMLQVLIEGGSAIYSSLIKENLLNQMHIYVGNRILGSDGLPLFSDLSIGSMNDAMHFTFEGSQAFGETLRIDYRETHEAS